MNELRLALFGPTLKPPLPCLPECWLALFACLEEAIAGRSCQVAELGEALAPSELDGQAWPLEPNTAPWRPWRIRLG